MAQASDALRSARVYLGDINGSTWSDAHLMPFLQEAHSEMVQELELNNTGNLKFQSAPIIVQAGATTLGNNQPTNLINPIEMMEGDPGTDPESYQDMIKVNFLPYIDQDTWLTYWAWIGQVITFLGATATRSVMLRYEGFALPTPQIATDSLGVTFAERYLGPRTAALALSSIQRDNKYLLSLADAALYRIVQSLVNNDQTPVRRKGYRRPKSGWGTWGPVSIPVGASGTGGSGGTVSWILPLNLADGVRTQFQFASRPNFCSYNGVNQFQGAGYTLSQISGTWTVTFLDILGVIIAPPIGTDIRAEIS